jgi:hypothetical protein
MSPRGLALRRLVPFVSCFGSGTTVTTSVLLPGIAFLPRLRRFGVRSRHPSVLEWFTKEPESSSGSIASLS